ncbi:amidohydrolase family protein [Streptomyces sp. NPDC001617]
MVLVAFDIETVIGAPPCSNDYVTELRAKYRERVIHTWRAMDPFKGEAAIDEAKRAVTELGVLGFHFHPVMGRCAVDDRALSPLFETISGLGAPVMIDVGTTGMGAGMPGGLGSRLEHAHPLAVDHLAADFPDMTIIAAHPGRPWVDEVTAVALHKGNVFWELSTATPSGYSASDLGPSAPALRRLRRRGGSRGARPHQRADGGQGYGPCPPFVVGARPYDRGMTLR